MTKIQWSDTPFRFRAAAATRIGLPLAEYDAHRAAGEKWCMGCRAWHDRGLFGADRSRGDGLASKCGACRVSTNGPHPGARARRAAAQTGRAWCRGCQAWLSAAEVWKGACRTHRNAEARAFYGLRRREIAAKKLARKRGLAPIPTWWRDERFEEFGGMCAYGCSRPAAVLDHVWPVAHGGASQPSNLVPACVGCNSSKKDGDPDPWLAKFMASCPEQFDNFSALNCEHNGPFAPDVEAPYV